MPERNNRRRYDAPAAGAFGGVATLGLGQQIPDTYPVLKNAIVYGSPIFSLVYAGLVQSGFIWAVATMKRREVEKALRRVRRIRDEAHASEVATAPHKKRLQETVENTELLVSKMATASNRAVVDEFTDISISDVMAATTAALEREGALVSAAFDGEDGEDGEDDAPNQRPDNTQRTAIRGTAAAGVTANADVAPTVAARKPAAPRRQNGRGGAAKT